MFFELYILLISFVLAFLAGDMAEARCHAQRMLPVSERLRLSANTLWAHYYLGCVAYASLELDVAQRHFEVVAARRNEAARSINSLWRAYIKSSWLAISANQEDPQLRSHTGHEPCEFVN